MNEKLQYAAMLDMPVNTCNVTVKTKKKKPFAKKRRSPEEVKKQLLDKVNADGQESASPTECEKEDCQRENFSSSQESVVVKKKSEKRGNFKINGTAVAFIVIGALIAVIFLTSAFYPNSGINAFIQTVFNSGESPSTVVDDRTFEDFEPTIVFAGSKTENGNGITGLSGKSSVYSVADGTVDYAVMEENGKYTVRVLHSDNFSSVLTGLDFVYVSAGESVYSSLPLGYIKEEGAVSFMDGETLITDYRIVDNTVIWGV